MASLRKRGRVWYFRYSDADGVKHEVNGCPDRRVTEELARAPNPRPPRSKPAWLTRGSWPGSSIPAIPWMTISRSTGRA